MNVVAVDDESISLDCLSFVLSNSSRIKKVESFLNPEKCLEWFKNHKADIAFLDIEMKEMSGLALAAQIRTICPSCSIVFVTSHSDYAVEAFKIHANGYIIKPVTKEAVDEEIKNLLNGSKIISEEGDDKIRINCFGNFEAFYKNEQIKFTLTKSKELFAYLIHKKGAAISMAELAAILYEDKADNESTQSQLRNVISEMRKSIQKAGIPYELFEKSRGIISVKTEYLNCDYYDFLNGKTSAVNSYTGEYMSQYSWAEFTVGYLESILYK